MSGEWNMTERIQKIMDNMHYQAHYTRIETCEVNRVFCKHDMVHFLDVARIAEILNLKEGIGVSEEFIYAAALLHDIGRHVEYSEGTRHEQASIPIAREILEECGFEEKEADVILKAIGFHRTMEIKDNRDLNGLLYRADKLSRPCFSCKMESACNWKRDKKNLVLRQ